MRLSWLTLTLAGICLLSLTQGAIAGVNIVVNGGFENPLPAGWETVSFVPAGAPPTRDAATVHSGIYSLRIGGHGDQWASQTLAVGCETYEASGLEFWVNVSPNYPDLNRTNSDPSFWVMMFFLDDSSFADQVDKTDLVLSWQKFNYSVPSGKVVSRITFAIGNYQDVDGEPVSIFLDDVSLYGGGKCFSPDAYPNAPSSFVFPGIGTVLVLIGCLAALGAYGLYRRRR